MFEGIPELRRADRDLETLLKLMNDAMACCIDAKNICDRYAYDQEDDRYEDLFNDIAQVYYMVDRAHDSLGYTYTDVKITQEALWRRFG